jgi:hypothetical protein
MDAFDRLATSPGERVGLPPAGASAALHELFLGVAMAEWYEEILACLLGAEWAVPDLVLAGQSDAFGAARDPRLGGVSRGRRVRGGGQFAAQRARRTLPEPSGGSEDASRNSLRARGRSGDSFPCHRIFRRRQVALTSFGSRLERPF